MRVPTPERPAPLMERSSLQPADVPASTTAGDQRSDSDAEGVPLVAHPVWIGGSAVAIAALAYASYPSISRSLLAAFFAATLVVLAGIDLERRIIPNVIVLPATLIVLAAHIGIAPGRTVELILAPLAVAVFLFLPNFFTSNAIGMGDVKLGLLLGAGLGWGAIGALLVGFLSTLPFAIAALARGGAAARKQMLPLGPFLSFGGLVVLIVPRLL
jgi:leader peptidase (prepilin peptidase) / N-methyltransferase